MVKNIKLAVKLHNNCLVQSYHKNAGRNGLVNTIHNLVNAWFILFFFFLPEKPSIK